MSTRDGSANARPEDKPVQSGRRGFLRRMKDSSLLAGAAAVGAGTTSLGQPPQQADAGHHEQPGRYQLSEHIRKYYATARVF